MALTTIKTRFAALVCALAMVSFSGTALADSGSGSSGGGGDDEDGGALIVVVINNDGDTEVMNEVEIRQRCENEAEFVVNNTQICQNMIG